MKRIKLVITAILATATLSGCTAFPIWEDPSDSGNITFSFESRQSSLSSSSASSASSESSSASSESSSAPSSSETPGESENSSDTGSENTYPINVGYECYLTIEDGGVFVRYGKDSEVVRVICGDRDKFSEENGIVTAKLDLSDVRNGYFDVYIVDKFSSSHNVRLFMDNGKVQFPEVSDVAENNSSTAENPTELTFAQTVRYITKSGSAKGAAEILDEVKKISDEICEGITDDYDKLRAISDWVADNIYYDHEAYDSGNMEECVTLEYMLDKHASVCGGYATFTSALCEAQGIYCVNIDGEAINTARCFAELKHGNHHEWNYAVIDGRGIWVDSGWNSYNNLYSGGRYSHGGIGGFYFDIGNDVFALDHKVNTAALRNYFE